MIVADALRAGTARLTAAGVPDAARDARWLLAHMMGFAPDRLVLHLQDEVGARAAARFETALTAREARQPVAQIVGERLFWGRRFRVTREVLDPRPETESLIALALTERFGSVLDMGTGSGAIALTLMAETGAATTATDLSPGALAVAGENAARLGLHPTFLLSDWFQRVEGRFDLIVSNPPYIAEAEMTALAPEVRDWEPRMALTPGGDGLDAYRAIAAGAGAHLAPGGRLLVEIGAEQGAPVAALFRATGLDDVRIHPDMDGRDRVVAGRTPRIG
ncbi:peptide chain release factor N(5)-glutamine methyltransferase [Falsirhodobacter sp. 20TX0035]|uniref:peptide chain release factor N(5)-glutamine methyltransferase n=1 Tax=Falsirhodobacter sp. 20TX0035 TaxID=3022019 RepID=UPI00232FCE02|nr:peptide chain release factor N(5)-glutamine methyltransferase [Falsirhodobacter sp. 20TX0035]MDB6453134.1 peptide chain release factor N(5)-glutamine methyltransferase [Falsirhodobacter sp. 20TX0035]